MEPCYKIGQRVKVIPHYSEHKTSQTTHKMLVIPELLKLLMNMHQQNGTITFMESALTVLNVSIMP